MTFIMTIDRTGHDAAVFFFNLWAAIRSSRLWTSMRSLLAFIGMMFLASCVTHGVPSSVPSSPSLLAGVDEQGVTTYYDRNHDGKVDLELHQFGCCDRDWALVDTHFTGRYDLKVRWGYGLEKSHIDLPVPKNVHISSGDLPVSIPW